MLGQPPQMRKTAQPVPRTWCRSMWNRQCIDQDMHQSLRIKRYAIYGEHIFDRPLADMGQQRVLSPIDCHRMVMEMLTSTHLSSIKLIYTSILLCLRTSPSCSHDRSCDLLRTSQATVHLVVLRLQVVVERLANTFARHLSLSIQRFT